jgi:Leucine-rich repeat (LRR) protein
MNYAVMTLLNKYKLICNALLSLLLLITISSSAQNIVSDDEERTALQALYDNTNGPNWAMGARWTQGQIDSYPDSVMYGVEIDNGDITSISLNGAGLSGTLPSQLSGLTQLKYLALSSNNLTGELPNLGALQNLVSLYLRDTDFSGDFPVWLTSISSLISVDLNSKVNTSTCIHGPIPTSISQLSNLSQFAFANNDLSAAGSIPESFSNLDNLLSLNFENCRLEVNSVSSGALTGLRNLFFLDLNNNPQFKTVDNVFPDILIDLPNLNTIFLDKSDFSKFPASFDALKKLKYLSLNYCSFSDTVKIKSLVDTLANCLSLQTLTMIGSNINALPSNLNRLSTVEYLYLSQNPLVPEDCNILGDMPMLNRLYIDNCNLSSLPTNLTSSETLKSLYAPFNKLYPIPEHLKDIPNLTNLNLAWNGIGALPDWFGDSAMASLETLTLSNNNIPLPFPDHFKKLVNLKTLELNFNKMEGELDSFFSIFTALETLNLAHNKLTSDLPDLSQLTKLNNLFLNNNNFTGSIPEYFSTLGIPRSILDIGYNHFDAFKPFTSNTSLSFRLNNNKFEFSDVLKQTVQLNTYYYPSQDSVDVKKTLVAYDGFDLTLIAAVDTASYLNCSFQWFKIKNGITTAISTSSTSASVFTVNDITPADVGTKFFYKITNNAAPQLTLISRVQTLTTVIDEGDDGGSGNTSCESTLASEYYALMSFYHATNNGEGWQNKTGWKDANPNIVQSVVGWFGITTDENGFVTRLSLNGNNLNGIIPSQIGNLKHLVELHLSNNNLAGSLPSSIGRLCKLEQLFIRNSRLTNALPSSIGKLTALRAVRLDINELFGSIPSSIGNLDNLRLFDLSYNRLTGSIPSEAGGMASLVELNLNANQIENAIPASLGNLSTLQYLLLSNNKLTGIIPPSLGNLGELLTLDLSTNKLDGPIPVVLGTLSKLKSLSLYINLLSGSIPSEIGNLQDLEFLSVTSNQLTGSIPTSIGNLKKLQYLAARNNHLSGSIPSSIGNATSLRGLSLDINELSGPVPSTIGNLTDLISLDLSYNRLTEALPSEIGNLFNLKYLYITNNQLSNALPASFGNLQSVQYIALSNNQLIGTLPPSMINLSNLINLDVSVNKLSGDVPIIESLTNLNITVNKFTFSDFLPVKQNSSNLAVIYYRQDSVDVEKKIVGLPGKSLTLTAAVDRNTTPASKYQWFKYINGISTPVTSSPSETGYSYTISSLSPSDNGVRYYYTITNTDGSDLTLVSRMQQVIFGCKAPPVNIFFTTRKYLCALKFVPSVQGPTSCRTANYTWDFGDGTNTTAERIPLHAFRQAGTYNVTLRLNYNCGACIGDTTIIKSVVFNPSENVLMDTLLEAETDIKEEVITASASTFSDVWPLLQDNAAIDGMNSFMNGTSGVWRNDGAYVYNTERKKSEAVNIAKDGTFTLENFNWDFAEYDMIPKWIKANNMTLYSPYSYELENRDVLGVYSAALYDYGGHLPSANGVNMRYAEMAFTSFEYLDGKVSGNWMFGTQSTLKNKTYKVFNANSNMAIVEMSLKELGTVQKVDVIGRRKIGFGKRRSIYIKDDEIVCSQPYPNNPEWTILVLKQAPSIGVWKGSIVVKKDVPPVVNPDIDNNVAHSGKSSLKVTTSKIFTQNLLSLDSAKSYYVTCWVSVNDPNVATPILADNLGFDIVVKNRDGLVVATNTFQPTGAIIEGWQQIRGSFTCPVNNSLIEITFKPGSKGTAWYDDLRLHPEKGNMKSYVYNLSDYRLQAILDEENFASFFYYDAEGNLYLTKKETEEGVKTISENISYQREKQ